MKFCDCGSEMVAKSNEGNVWACGSPDCDYVEPIKKCTKCSRILHAPCLPVEHDERCVCCDDNLGHDVSTNNTPIDWDEVPCCPECGSFDVRLRAKVTMDGWTKFNSNTGEQSITDTDEFLADSENAEEMGVDGGHCDSCDADWDNDRSCVGGDWNNCRPEFLGIFSGEASHSATMYVRARGLEDAKAKFEEAAKTGAADLPWEYDGSQVPYNVELNEIMVESTGEIGWTPPDPPENENALTIHLPNGAVVKRHLGGIDITWPKVEGEENATSIFLNNEILAGLDMIRRAH